MMKIEPEAFSRGRELVRAARARRWNPTAYSRTGYRAGVKLCREDRERIKRQIHAIQRARHHRQRHIDRQKERWASAA